MRFVAIAFLFCIGFEHAVAQVSPDSLDVKIGQMIMIGIGDRTSFSAGGALGRELAEGKIGGVVLFEKNVAQTNSAERLKSLIAGLQTQARTRLFVSIDEEGGKVHRLKQKYGFFDLPSAASLGRQDNPEASLRVYRKLAEMLRELGINLNYAPSVDVAVNPKNTVIVQAQRSYSSQPAVVARHAAICVLAHREKNIGTVLKHFPGHGSSSGDSHLGLVDVSKTWQPKELRPFDTLIKAGLCDAVMIAHIINRTWDAGMLPATLSHKVVTGMLREKLGFKGVVFSDDMQMKAIADNYGLERAIGLAINAGIDVLMFGNTVAGVTEGVTATKIHAIIRKLVLNKTISPQRIDESHRRIVAMKSKCF